jgi:hypothetical protein
MRGNQLGPHRIDLRLARHRVGASIGIGGQQNAVRPCAIGGAVHGNPPRHSDAGALWREQHVHSIDGERETFGDAAHGVRGPVGAVV